MFERGSRFNHAGGLGKPVQENEGYSSVNTEYISKGIIGGDLEAEE